MSKKKKGGMGKKKGGDDEDLSTEELYNNYRKNCTKNGVTMLKQIIDKFDYLFNEGEDLEELHLWEETGPVGMRCFCEALKDVKYKHLKSMRFWRVKAQDEGVRSICDYFEFGGPTKVTILDLLSNEITPLGCSFLAKILPGSGLTVLKLDHNQFGTAGLAELAKGLSRSATLTTLSLSYCNIDEKGVPFLHQILAYIKTDLQFLDLQGNTLKNEGVIDLFKVLEINEKLEEINLADNQFGEDPHVIEAICKVMRTTKSLGAYDFNYNGIYDEGANKFLEVLKAGNKKVHRLELSEKISREIIKEMEKIMKKNKPKKKKKKKKKAS